jgi:hypothetical protein
MAEHSIRRSFRKLNLNTAVRYGYIEEKRRRRKEDRKYINILEDYLGAKLRDIGAEHFKFPPPTLMDMDDDSKQWMYPGNNRNPTFAPRHTAPEQDFMDMIRSHGSELIRQCLKYGVPAKDAKRHIDELIDRLIPFLEYIYTERRIGRSGFTHGAAKELRIVVLKIRALFGRRNGRRQSVTGEIIEAQQADDATKSLELEVYDDQEIVVEEFHEYEDMLSSQDEEEDETDFENFFTNLTKRCNLNLYPSWKDQIDTLKEKIENGFLRPKDAEHLYNLLREETRRVGQAFHDFIANSDFTHRPFTLFGPLRYGDTMLSKPSEFLLTSETPVGNGRGRVDLTLYRNKTIEYADGKESESVWEICGVVELKTRSAFNLDMYSVPTKSKKHPKRRVIEFDYERRRLTDKEWNVAISSVPSPEEIDQLKAYEKLLLSDYEKITRIDKNPPEKLMKAVITVDAKENWELVRDNLLDLIMKAYEVSISGSLSAREYYQLKANGKSVHAGIMVFSDCDDVNVSQAKNPVQFDPFRYSKEREDSRKFVLYYTVSGKGSSQESAARIAAKWHGLEFIHKRMKGKHSNVIWLDFTGEYSDSILREHSLRLNLHSKSIQRFLRRRISFIDMSKEVQLYINGEKSLAIISEKIIRSFNRKRKTSIIVTGLDMIRRQTPKHKSSLLNEIIIQFINIVPEESSVIWFDRPVPLSQTCQRFDTRCVAPFYSNSPWKYVIDEIIWNLPMAPARYGSHIPVHDDVRVLVDEKCDSLEEDTILIPPLFKWGERFRPDRNRNDHISRQNVFYLKGAYSHVGPHHLGYYTQEDIDASFELVPHLLDFHNPRGRNKSVTIEQLVVSSSPAKRPSFLSLVSFTPFQLKMATKKKSKKKDNRVKRFQPFAKINHAREYRTTRLYAKPPKMTIKPPHISLLQYEEKTELAIARSELSGIRLTIKLLKKIFETDKEWIMFFDELNDIVRVKNASFNILRQVRIFLETQVKSKSVWNMLRPTRSWFSRELNYEQQDAMKKLLNQYPDLLFITGNQFFLFLLAAFHKGGVNEPMTGLIESIWDYLEPWQYVGLGFIPHYHAQHRTGQSVLHRSGLLKMLINRVKNTKKLLETEQVSEVQFGLAIPISINENSPPTALWLVFQSEPASHEMIACLIPISDAEDWDVVHLLKSLPREKSYWGETDLSNLGALAQDVDLISGIPIMIARHQRVRGLWVRGKKKWFPIGRIEYYTRRRETVTLLRSITLRQYSSIQEIERNDVRNPPGDLDINIEVALGTIDAAFRHCENIRCRVILNEDEGMFELIFLSADDTEEGYLLVKRTADVIELLRRPDFECEPVEVNGHHYVWSRFKDIKYEGDAIVLKPWVIRKDPFKQPDLNLPPTAEHLVNAIKKKRIRLTVIHDPFICPLRSEDLKIIMERQSWTPSEIKDYLQRMEGHPEQPDELLNESIHIHGTCWRLHFTSSDAIPDQIKKLETVRLSGAALATLLKTGVLSYESDNGWAFHEFYIPDSKDLPKEFQESIHLMEWHREKASAPGVYLLEGWKPSISIRTDRIECKLFSEMTQERRIRTIYETRAEKMHPEHLRAILLHEMEALLSEVGLEDNRRVMNFIHKELDEFVELVTYEEPQSLLYQGLSRTRDSSTGEVLVASFQLGNGEYMSIQVTNWIHEYVSGTEFAGGIEIDFVKEGVSEKLSQYPIDERDIEQVIDDVIEVLENAGAKFYEY